VRKGGCAGDISKLVLSDRTMLPEHWIILPGDMGYLCLQFVRKACFHGLLTAYESVDGRQPNGGIHGEIACLNE